jgi:TIR domain
MNRPVFVSYSQPDHDAAFEIVERVEARGMACWIAPRDVQPAADWAAEIVSAIAQARIMVLLFSASANASPQVRREVERAVHRKVTVLAFRLEEVLPSHSLEYFLSSQHWLDAFPPPRAPHYARLCDYLSTLLNTVSEPAAASAPASSTIGEPLEARQLQALESELARYLGPVARHLVSRAAAQASGLDALIVRLGGEIDAESERREFIASARTLLRSLK